MKPTPICQYCTESLRGCEGQDNERTICDEYQDIVWHLKCLKCGDTYDMKLRDVEKYLPHSPLGYTIYSHCNKCRGPAIMKKYPDFRLKNCPFCGDSMAYEHYCYYDKYEHFIQMCSWAHENIRDCVLDDISNGFTIGAGDARPEDGYVGEYGERWNERKI